MKYSWLFFCALLLAVVLSGCASGNIFNSHTQTPIIVTRINEPVKLDGKLEEPFWAQLPEHHFTQIDDISNKSPLEAARARQDKFQGAWVKAAYDDKYVYIAARLENDDVISYARKDGGFLFQQADTLEIFFWAEGKSPYWEMYSTPSGHKHNLAYPSGGVLSVSAFLLNAGVAPGLEIASHVYGKINDRSDRDECWTTEMRISRKMFADAGVPFEPGTAWRILAARYGYSGFLYRRQASAFPKQPAFNFHARNYYAPVIFR